MLVVASRHASNRLQAVRACRCVQIIDEKSPQNHDEAHERGDENIQQVMPVLGESNGHKVLTNGRKKWMPPCLEAVGRQKCVLFMSTDVRRGHTCLHNRMPPNRGEALEEEGEGEGGEGGREGRGGGGGRGQKGVVWGGRWEGRETGKVEKRG